MLENVRALETLAEERLRAMHALHASIGDVRAVGYFLAVEFVKDRDSKERDPGLTRAVAETCMRRGLLVEPSSTSLNIQPSLVTPPEVLDAGLTILAESIDECERAP